MRATPLNESVFENLAASGGEDLVSIFIPTHQTGRDIAQDRIHLKNGLTSVEHELAELGWKPRQVSQRLEQASDLLDDLEFWEHQNAGLAVYIDGDGTMEPISTKVTLTTDSVVMPVFLLRPLIADIGGMSLPVLALSRDSVALFESTESAAEQIETELPSYDDVNWFVDREKERQQHPDMAGTDRSRHGHEPSSRADEDLARFLREVDSALSRFDTEDPVIVLGDDDLVARFANHSERSTLSPGNSGISAPFSVSDVQERVSSLILDLDLDRLEEARTRALDRLGVGMAATDLEEALLAAVSGRVGELIINRNAAPVWGRLERSSHDVDVHPSQQPGDVDLVDRLVVWSWENGAEVLSAESDIDGRPFIASFRY